MNARKLKLIVLILITFVFFIAHKACFAQDPGENLQIGVHKIVHSGILNEDRNVHVFLPKGYSDSRDRYPVLYTLYSNIRDFHFYTGIVNGLSRIRIIPELIVAAVDLGDGMRDLTPTKSPDYGPTSGGAANYLKFLKDELIPYIEDNYRTQSERLYWSHSIGGLFGLYAFMSEPDLFESCLVSSPFFVYDGDEKYLIKNTESFLENRNGMEGFIYICVGDESRLVTQIEEFLRILENRNVKGLKWLYDKMPGETHMSILARSLTEGLRAKFIRAK